LLQTLSHLLTDCCCSLIARHTAFHQSTWHGSLTMCLAGEGEADVSPQLGACAAGQLFKDTTLGYTTTLNMHACALCLLGCR
jgi:hypothetical protein